MKDRLSRLSLRGALHNRATKQSKKGLPRSFHSLAMTNKGTRKPKVYIEEWFDPPMASGNWVTEVIGAVGAAPMLKKGEMSREVTLSQIEGFDPDVIVLAYCGYGTKSDPNVIKKRWPNLGAVKANKVFAIDEGVLNRPGPRIWKAAEELAKICASAQ